MSSFGLFFDVESTPKDQKGILETVINFLHKSFDYDEWHEMDAPGHRDCMVYCIANIDCVIYTRNWQVRINVHWDFEMDISNTNSLCSRVELRFIKC